MFSMPAFVYILRSRSTGRHYTGSATELKRRLQDHRRGNTPSTRKQGPWDLVYFEECPDLAAARRRERMIKSWKGNDKFKGLLRREKS